MRDNHGIRYNPTNKTLVAVADGGEQLHQKQTGEYFLVNHDTITPLTHESAVRWMNRYCGGVVSRANTSQKNSTIDFVIPAELAHWLFCLTLDDDSPSLKEMVMSNLDHAIASALPPVTANGKRRCCINVTPEENEIIRLKAAEHGLSKRAFVSRLVTDIAHPGQY